MDWRHDPTLLDGLTQARPLVLTEHTGRQHREGGHWRFQGHGIQQLEQIIPPVGEGPIIERLTKLGWCVHPVVGGIGPIQTPSSYRRAVVCRSLAAVVCGPLKPSRLTTMSLRTQRYLRRLIASTAPTRSNDASFRHQHVFQRPRVLE